MNNILPTLFKKKKKIAASFELIPADLVVASAGEDKKISLWRKNGESMGTIPVAGTDSGDNIEVILF